MCTHAQIRRIKGERFSNRAIDLSNTPNVETMFVQTSYGVYVICDVMLMTTM